MQDTEMEYVTGRCMCHHQINHAFEADDVSRMVHRVFSGRVQFHDGTDELAPGISVHKIGGHTKGLQCVRVATERGPVVLASDATHFYAHIDSRRVFRVLYNQGDMLEGYNTLERLAGARERVIPGHDPLVLQHYPAASASTDGCSRRFTAAPMTTSGREPVKRLWCIPARRARSGADPLRALVPLHNYKPARRPRSSLAATSGVDVHGPKISPDLKF
jgi:glyoxylase-like metal-dependent hydrolase (beta-lactamase superfamily II)